MIPSKIIQIYIMEAEGGSLYFHMKYKKHITLEDNDPDLTAAWLTSVFIYAGANTGSLQKIKMGDYDILLRLGNETLLAVYIEKTIEEEEGHCREGMVLLQDGFEQKYRQHIKNFNGRIEIFRDFYFDALQNFPYFHFDFEMIIDSSDLRNLTTSLKGGTRVLEIIYPFINGIRRIKDIWNLCASNMTLKEFNAVLSFLYRSKRIVLKENLIRKQNLKQVTSIDIYGVPLPSYLIDKVLTPVYDAFGQKTVDAILEKCNGDMSCKEISDFLKADGSAVEYIVKRLLQTGVVVLIDKSQGMEWGELYH